VIRLRWLFCAALAAGALRADSREQILQRMDEGSKKLKTVSAKLHELSYNAVIQDTTTQEGELRLRRGKNGLSGVLMFTTPNDEHSIGFNGRTIETYFPKANQVDVMNVGKNAAQLDQFILLAFGAAGSDLEKNYEVSLAGTQAVNGTTCDHLELIPKSPEARKFATKIELWIPQGQSNAIQEKVTEPSNDYILNTYSEVKLNPSLPDSAYELKLPPGVKRINAK